MVTQPKIDLAKVAPCPKCGKPTRFMGGVPISGTGLDLHFADEVWCDECLQKKCDDAVAQLRGKGTT